MGDLTRRNRKGKGKKKGTRRFVSRYKKLRTPDRADFDASFRKGTTALKRKGRETVGELFKY